MSFLMQRPEVAAYHMLIVTLLYFQCYFCFILQTLKYLMFFLTTAVHAKKRFSLNCLQQYPDTFSEQLQFIISDSQVHYQTLVSKVQYLLFVNNNFICPPCLSGSQPLFVPFQALPFLISIHAHKVVPSIILSPTVITLCRSHLLKYAQFHFQ